MAGGGGEGALRRGKLKGPEMEEKRETFEQLAFANACHGFVTYMYHGRN